MHNNTIGYPWDDDRMPFESDTEYRWRKIEEAAQAERDRISDATAMAARVQRLTTEASTEGWTDEDVDLVIASMRAHKARGSQSTTGGRWVIRPIGRFAGYYGNRPAYQDLSGRIIPR